MITQGAAVADSEKQAEKNVALIRLGLSMHTWADEPGKCCFT